MSHVLSVDIPAPAVDRSFTTGTNGVLRPGFYCRDRNISAGDRHPHCRSSVVQELPSIFPWQPAVLLRLPTSSSFLRYFFRNAHLRYFFRNAHLFCHSTFLNKQLPDSLSLAEYVMRTNQLKPMKIAKSPQHRSSQNFQNKYSQTKYLSLPKAIDSTETTETMEKTEDYLWIWSGIRKPVIIKPHVFLLSGSPISGSDCITKSSQTNEHWENQHLYALYMWRHRRSSQIWVRTSVTYASLGIAQSATSCPTRSSDKYYTLFGINNIS